MTTMNLRVGFKGNALNADRRIMNAVYLSREFLDSMGFEVEDSDLKKEIESFCSTFSIEQQLLHLKALSKTYIDDASILSQDCNKFVKFLVEIFFVSEPKNPLKNAISRIFSVCRSELHPMVVECLGNRLTQLLNEATEMCDSSAPLSLNGGISALAVCLDNTLGVQAVSMCLKKAITYIYQCLDKHMQMISVERVPSQKQELHLYIHNATRVFIAILQKVLRPKAQQKPPLPPTTASTGAGDSVGRSDGSDASAGADTVSAGELPDKEALYAVLCRFVSMEELPLDSRTNCSLALASMTALTEGPEGWQSLLRVASGVAVSAEWCSVRSDPLTRLCLLSGLLGALPVAELAVPLPSAQPVNTSGDHQNVGPIALQCLFDTLIQLANWRPSEPTLELGAARALQRLVRGVVTTLGKGGSPDGKDVEGGVASLSLLDHDSVGKGIVGSPVGAEPGRADDVLPRIVDGMGERLLSLLWRLLDSGADAVRHAGRATLQAYAQAALACKARGSVKALELVTLLALQLPSFWKARYLALVALAAELPPHSFKSVAPSDLLNALDDKILCPAASSAYEALMRAEFHNSKPEQWEARWVAPLADALSSYGAGSARLASEVEELLGKAVRLHPTAAARLAAVVLCRTEDVAAAVKEGGEQAEAGRLRTLLACLRAAHRQGAFDKADDSVPGLWQGTVDFGLLQVAAVHACDEVRLSALALVVEAHRSTQPLTRQELRLAQTILTHTANAQAPATRQQAAGTVKKLLVRLRDSGAVMLKRTGTTTDRYCTFMEWLVEFSFSNLFPGANFGRRSLSLRLLCLVVEVMGCGAPGPGVPDCLWTRFNGDVLLDMLRDSYEENKQVALWLIRHAPAQALNFHEVMFVQSLLMHCQVLAVSSRPPDSASAAYVLRAIASFPSSPAVRTAVLQLERNVSYSYTLPHTVLPDDTPAVLLQLHLARALTHILAEEVSQAHANVLAAAARRPMYGALLCLRMLLEDVDFESVACDNEWCDELSWIMANCYNACAAIEHVVNSASPEGHLPMDSQLASELLPPQSPTGGAAEKLAAVPAPEAPVAAVTAQAVLLCAWRTVKESSLLLGMLAERVPVIPISAAMPEPEGAGGASTPPPPPQAPRGLLSETQLVHMGTHFTRLLANIKHRGAFEQAYIGFCKLCSRLWSMGEGSGSSLHELPSCWLEELLELVATDDSDASMGGTTVHLCTTRRSAGVPFLVQALLTTEPQGRGGVQPMFGRCVETLLGLAEAPPAPCSSADLRVHALNILRALFRAAQLAERATPYLARAVEVAVRGFRSHSWSERNAATLLFASLMTRLFGTSRARDQERQRRMTGRLFFHQYPRLYDFLLAELSLPSSAPDPMLEQLGGGVFPSLVLLSRLYPSSLEGTDSHLQLSRFVPLVQACAGASVERTRALAARALVPLVPGEEWVATASALLAAAANPQPLVPWNTRHGLLLQVTSLVEAFLTPSSLQPPVAQWLETSAWLLALPRRQVRCFAVAEAYVHLLHALAPALPPPQAAPRRTPPRSVTIPRRPATAPAAKEGNSTAAVPASAHRTTSAVGGATSPGPGCKAGAQGAPSALWHVVRHELEEALLVAPATALPTLARARLPALAIYNMRAARLLLHLTRMLGVDRRVEAGEEPAQCASAAVQLAARLVALGTKGCSDTPLAAATWARQVLCPATPDTKICLPYEPWNTEDKAWKGLKMQDAHLERALCRCKAFATAVAAMVAQPPTTSAELFEVQQCCFQLLPCLPLAIDALADQLAAQEKGVKAEEHKQKDYGALVLWLLDAMKEDPEGAGAPALATAANAAVLSTAGAVLDAVCLAVERGAAATAPLALRRAAAAALADWPAQLLFLADPSAPPPDAPTPLALCHAWNALVQLLDDDDHEVRSIAAYLASAVPSPPRGAVAPGYARERLVAAFTEGPLFAHFPLYVCATLAAWSLQRTGASRETFVPKEAEERGGGGLFERSESSAFAEPALLADLAAERLGILCAKDESLLEATLPEDACRWVAEFCWCAPCDGEPADDEEEEGEVEFRTLEELSVRAGERLAAASQSGARSFAFFLSDRAHVVSAGYRLRKFRDALHPPPEQRMYSVMPKMPPGVKPIPMP